jgi:hypothetical protein
MLATIRYGMPTALAQKMPRPIIGTRARYWLLMWDTQMSAMAPSPSAIACTRLAPIRCANPTRNSAETMVKKL